MEYNTDFTIVKNSGSNLQENKNTNNFKHNNNTTSSATQSFSAPASLSFTHVNHSNTKNINHQVGTIAPPNTPIHHDSTSRYSNPYACAYDRHYSSDTIGANVN
jgi:hypothetical protein